MSKGGFRKGANWPLRRVVSGETVDGSVWETLECGHRIMQKQDFHGPTNAVRRRCRHCAVEIPPDHKFCCECRKVLPKDVFSGQLCRPCAAVTWQRRYAERREAYLAHQSQHRVGNLDVQARTRERHAEHRGARKTSYEAYRARFPDRLKAQWAVNNAVADGRLRPMLCWVCGGVAQAHHASYAEDAQLDVTWLCPSHHRKTHIQHAARERETHDR